MKLIGYVRVSTRSQNYEGQIAQIQQFCKARGHELVEIYHEKESGAKERPEFTKAIEALENADGLVATKIDRISRSFKQFINLVSELENKGKALICVQQNIDTSDSSPTGRAFVRMLGVFAELEREFILERIAEGGERARAMGKPLGGPKPREVDLSILRALRREGHSNAMLAKKFKVSRGTIANRIKQMELKT